MYEPILPMLGSGKKWKPLSRVMLKFHSLPPFSAKSKVTL